ncbi:hypothetical protein ACFSF1_08525, partial [Pseudonocardia alaniniphila]
TTASTPASATTTSAKPRARTGWCAHDRLRGGVRRQLGGLAAATLVRQHLDLTIQPGERVALDTRLGDGGIGLTGGPRQGVGVPLLDEPTTGFDSHAERLVVQTLTRLVQGRAVVMTTHRPALIRLATRTVDIHDGVVRHLAG